MSLIWKVMEQEGKKSMASQSESVCEVCVWGENRLRLTCLVLFRLPAALSLSSKRMLGSKIYMCVCWESDEMMQFCHEEKGNNRVSSLGFEKVPCWVMKINLKTLFESLLTIISCHVSFWVDSRLSACSIAAASYFFYLFISTKNNYRSRRTNKV